MHMYHLQGVLTVLCLVTKLKVPQSNILFIYAYYILNYLNSEVLTAVQIHVTVAVQSGRWVSTFQTKCSYLHL